SATRSGGDADSCSGPNAALGAGAAQRHGPAAAGADALGDPATEPTRTAHSLSGRTASNRERERVLSLAALTLPLVPASPPSPLAHTSNPNRPLVRLLLG